MEKYEFWNKCCPKWALNMLISAELSCKSTERSTSHDKAPFTSIFHWLQFMEGILVVQWLAWVQSLAGDLRSHEWRDMTKNIKIDNKWFLIPKQGEIPTFSNKFLIFYQEFPIRVINKWFWLKATALKIGVLFADEELLCLWETHWCVYIISTSRFLKCNQTREELHGTEGFKHFLA